MRNHASLKPWAAHSRCISITFYVGNAPIAYWSSFAEIINCVRPAPRIIDLFENIRPFGWSHFLMIQKRVRVKNVQKIGHMVIGARYKFHCAFYVFIKILKVCLVVD